MRGDLVHQPEQPLAGSTILVTRAAARAGRLIALLEQRGARVLSYAATEIVLRDIDGLMEAARHLARYDWVVFTSATAVGLTFDATEACGVTAADWAFTRVAVIGSGTAQAVRERGVEPTLMPDTFVAEDFLHELIAHGDVAGSHVLYPVATGARPHLYAGLQEHGAVVDRVEVYSSVPSNDHIDDVRATLAASQVDLVTLTASSAVHAYATAMDPMYKWTDAVSIGPITTQAAATAGIRVVAEAVPSTLDGLVAAVVRAIDDKRQRINSRTQIS